MRARSFAFGVVLVLGVAITACGRSGDAQAGGSARLAVFAASSMTEPMVRIVAEFERQQGLAAELHCAGTPYLVMQMREGAVADVFVSADEASMARVERELGVVSPPRVFATNALAIAVAVGNPKGLVSLADLARPDLLVALCGPDVPAGRYAREACRKAGVEVRSVSDEPNVKALLTKVRLGEVDAGILYVSDLATAGGSVDAVAIPEAHNVRAAYPVAIPASTARRHAAERFVEFLFSETARRELMAAGFNVP